MFNPITDHNDEMKVINANEAKTNFGKLLLYARRAPIQIKKNGKPVAMILSIDDYQEMDLLKMQLLREKLDRARRDVDSGELVDGPDFIADLVANVDEGG